MPSIHACLGCAPSGIFLSEMDHATPLRIPAPVGLDSLSGCRWQLNQVPAVRYPPYVVEVRTGYRVSAHDRERCVALQGRVAPCRVVVGLEVGELQLQIPASDDDFD